MNSNKKISRKAKSLPQFSIYSGNKPPLDLLEIQRKSFCDLLERGIIDELSKTDTFRETAKFSGFTQELELVFNPDTYKLVSPNCTPKEAILKGKTYACKLYVQATLTIRFSPRGSACSVREERETEKQPSVVPRFSQPKVVHSEKNSVHLVETTKKPKAALLPCSNSLRECDKATLPFKYPEKSLRYLQSLQPHLRCNVSWTENSGSMERLPIDPPAALTSNQSVRSNPRAEKKAWSQCLLRTKNSIQMVFAYPDTVGVRIRSCFTRQSAPLGAQKMYQANDIKRQSKNGTYIFSVPKEKGLPITFDEKKKNIKRSTTTFIGSPIIKKVVALLSNKKIHRGVDDGTDVACASHGKTDAYLPCTYGAKATWTNVTEGKHSPFQECTYIFSVPKRRTPLVHIKNASNQPLVELTGSCTGSAKVAFCKQQSIQNKKKKIDDLTSFASNAWSYDEKDQRLLLHLLSPLNLLSPKEEIKAFMSTARCKMHAVQPYSYATFARLTLVETPAVWNDVAYKGSFADTKFFDKKENKKWNRVKKYPVLATPLSFIRSSTSFDFVPGHQVANDIALVTRPRVTSAMCAPNAPRFSLCAKLNKHLGWFYTCFVRADLMHNLRSKEARLTQQNQASFFAFAHTVNVAFSVFSRDLHQLVHNQVYLIDQGKRHLKSLFSTPHDVSIVSRKQPFSPVPVNASSQPLAELRISEGGKLGNALSHSMHEVQRLPSAKRSEFFGVTPSVLLHQQQQGVTNDTKFTSLICRLPKAAFAPPVHKQISDIMSRFPIAGGNQTEGAKVVFSTQCAQRKGVSSIDNTGTPPSKKKDEAVTQRVKIFRPWIFLGELPLMTKRGHFILNGSPRVIVNQMARCPGIYFQEKRRGVGFEQEVRVSADLIPQRGPWLRIQSDWEGRFWARLKREGRVKYATLYEAFQEFEKQYSAPLVSLVTNSSSSFPKSEILAFQERKVKEDRQKKALVRFFKNSTRYSLGKQGRLRINQRVHSSQLESCGSPSYGANSGLKRCDSSVPQMQLATLLPKVNDGKKTSQPSTWFHIVDNKKNAASLLKNYNQLFFLSSLTTNRMFASNQPLQNVDQRYNRLDWLYVQLMKKSSLLSIMHVHPKVQRNFYCETASAVNNSGANKLITPTFFTIKDVNLLKNKEKNPQVVCLDRLDGLGVEEGLPKANNALLWLHRRCMYIFDVHKPNHVKKQKVACASHGKDRQYWASARKDSEELHKFWSSFFSTRSPFQRLTNLLCIENVRQFINLKKPNSNAIFALNSNSNLLGKLTAILSRHQRCTPCNRISGRVDVLPYRTHGVSWNKQHQRSVGPKKVQGVDTKRAENMQPQPFQLMCINSAPHRRTESFAAFVVSRDTSSLSAKLFHKTLIDQDNLYLSSPSQSMEYKLPIDPPAALRSKMYNPFASKMHKEQCLLRTNKNSIQKVGRVTGMHQANDRKNPVDDDAMHVVQRSAKEHLLMAADVNAIHICLEHLLEGQGFTDDIDHLKNRLVRTSGKLLQQQLELGLDRLNEVMTPLLGNLIQGQLLSSLLPSQDTEKSSTTLRYQGRAPRAEKMHSVSLDHKKRNIRLASHEKESNDLRFANHSLKPIASLSTEGGKSKLQQVKKIGSRLDGPGVGVKNQKQGRGFISQDKEDAPKVIPVKSLEKPCKVQFTEVDEGVKRSGNASYTSCEAGVRITTKESAKKIALSHSMHEVQRSEFEQGGKQVKNASAIVSDTSSMSQSKAGSQDISGVVDQLSASSPQENSARRSSSLQQTPFRWLRTSKPVNNAFREFFGSNPLSQYMDQTNPLAEITHKRRLSSMGPGGIKRETAGMEVRGIHPTHYGRVCPIETPEGKNAGLVNSPTVYGRIGKNGFMETPLYQVVESQVQKERWAFFSAQQEEIEESSLATGDTGVTRFNFLSHVPIPVQTANNPLAHFQQVERNRVGYKALSPVQTISIATALIPFLEHDDANRALMGSNMQRQAIPLLSPERPIVGTGFEPMVMSESGQAIQATKMGCVSHVSANKIILETISEAYSTYASLEAPSTVRSCESTEPGEFSYSRIENGDSISNIYCKFFYTREKYNNVWWNRTIFTRCLEPPFLNGLTRNTKGAESMKDGGCLPCEAQATSVPADEEPKADTPKNKKIGDLMKLVDDNNIFNQLIFENEQTNSFLQTALVLYHRRFNIEDVVSGALEMQLSLRSASKMHNQRCKQLTARVTCTEGAKKMLQVQGLLQSIVGASNQPLRCIFDFPHASIQPSKETTFTCSISSVGFCNISSVHAAKLQTSSTRAQLYFGLHRRCIVQRSLINFWSFLKIFCETRKNSRGFKVGNYLVSESDYVECRLPCSIRWTPHRFSHSSVSRKKTDVTEGKVWWNTHQVKNPSWVVHRRCIGKNSFLNSFSPSGNALSHSMHEVQRLPSAKRSEFFGVTPFAKQVLLHQQGAPQGMVENNKSPDFQFCWGNTAKDERQLVKIVGVKDMHRLSPQVNGFTSLALAPKVHVHVERQDSILQSGYNKNITNDDVHQIAKRSPWEMDKKSVHKNQPLMGLATDAQQGTTRVDDQMFGTAQRFSVFLRDTWSGNRNSSVHASTQPSPIEQAGVMLTMLRVASLMHQRRCYKTNQNLHISKKIPHQTATNLHLCSTQSAFLFKKVEQSLQLYQRSNQETCLSQRPLVREGDWVQKGDFLADCSASHSGDLALGKNVTVAYMPWEGYNFEDAIVISDRLVANDIYTSIHIERYEIKVSKNSQGKERITNQIPSLSSQHLKHLSSDGIARVSSWVQPGDILVGKVVELKRPLSPYERLAWELASRLSPNSPEREKWLSKVWLEDISLRLPAGVCGRVINFQVISTEWSEKEHSLIPLEVHVYLAVKRKIQVGDKLAGRHGNKGIVSIVLPRQDMPYLGDGSSIDMVLNPLGVPSRMNLGQIFECLLGLAGSQLGCNFKVTPFDEIAGGEASRSLVFLKLYQCRLIHKQQWLFTPTFPGKNKLFDGRTGEPFENWVTVGQAYMLKLIHMVDHKIHARSTGPYSLFTRQPVRGRSRRGGQRLGEMEVWAVEGFGAAYTLQEFLTIKSDDLKARAALQRSFYKKNDVTLGKVHISPGNPEAFRVLVSELQALCLHIQM